MTTMIDIHCHILPGIDDGARDLAESVTMCRQAAETGCEALIATPHQRHRTWWNSEIRKLEALLRRVQDEVGPRPRLYLGGEIRVDRTWTHELDDLAKSGLVSLAGSSYLLLEFERQELTIEPVEVVERARAAGWTPIVAHPEFIRDLRSDLPLLHRLVEAGALMQITGMSVTGQFGERARAAAEALLDANLAHFMASDSHDVVNRQPGLTQAHRVVSETWGRETADRLTIVNPRAVVEHREIVTTLGEGRPPMSHSIEARVPTT